MNERIYLDYAATTPLRLDVLAALETILASPLGNPSSLHREGQHARAGLDRARQTAADLLGVMPSELTFTSGATESNNLLLRGLANHYHTADLTPHVIISALEHPSLRQTAEELSLTGQIELDVINPTADAVVSVEDVAEKIKPTTLLISVMAVSNEFGTIQPIKLLAALRDEVRAERQQTDNRLPILLHTDAVQVMQYTNLKTIPADSLTLSAHKAGGPLGVGLLVHRSTVRLRATQTGGNQESGLRAGTENTANLIAAQTLWLALNDGKARTLRRQQVSTLRQKLIDSFKSIRPDLIIIGQTCAPHILAVSFPGVDAKTLHIQADLAGISLSVGSACSSGTLTSSPALQALHLPPEVETGLCRFSLSEQTTEEEIETAVERLTPFITKEVS